MILLLIATVVLATFYLVHKKQRFWQDQKVLSEKPVSFVGNVWNLVAGQQSLFDCSIDMYNKFPGRRYYGYYVLLQPKFMVTDLDLIKQICIRDFDHFYDHTLFGDKQKEPAVCRNLFNLQGEDWRRMRSTLSPAFTSKKIREMFIFMCECASSFTDHLLKTKGKIEEEMFDLFSKAASDIISSAVFGIRQNSLENPDNDFYQSGMTTFDHMQGNHMVLSQNAPLLYKLLGCTVIPKHVVKFFSDVVKFNMEEREKRNIVRPDMIHLLMQAQRRQLTHEAANSTEVETGFATTKESQLEDPDHIQNTTLTHTDVVAQTLIFYMTGFETFSNAVSLTLYEMALNPNYQERLYEEIKETCEKCNGKLVYEELLNMKYLDQVVSETLRKWPTGFQLERMCVKEYTISPVTGDEATVTLQPGQQVTIPVAGIHRDPQYFPDPLKFDPDRFSDENKSKIVPGSYMPFGLGPRNCIASRFALLEIKVMLFYFLSKFSIIPVEKTQIPLRFSAGYLNLHAEYGYWLGMKPRENNF